ncbi:MAG: 50S ribosomal protein L30 [Candidatus Aenigmatarchaeota archaeon]
MLTVVRIRGTMNTRDTIGETLRMLRLDKTNMCVVLPDTQSFRGMLAKARGRTAYGTITLDTFKLLLTKRGRLEAGRRLSADTVKETGYESVEALAKAIFEGKARMADVPKLKPVFRLTPAVRGMKSAKQHWPKGDLGDRGEKMNELIKSMI